MRIACDVKGTLEGPKKAQVLEILRIFQAHGAKITIWSNLYSYASEAVSNNKGLYAEAESKCTKGDLDHDTTKYFDIAIEDDYMQSYLPAHRFIWVEDIPDNIVDVKEFVDKYLPSFPELSTFIDD